MMQVQQLQLCYQKKCKIVNILKHIYLKIEYDKLYDQIEQFETEIVLLSGNNQDIMDEFDLVWDHFEDTLQKFIDNY